MNILFVTKSLPYPPNAGFKKRTYHLIKGLSKDNRVSVICSGNYEQEKANVEALKECTHSITLIPSTQRHSRILNLFSPLPFNIKRWNSLLIKKAIEQIIKKEQIDLILCDSIYQAGNIPSNSCYKVLAEHNIESVIIRRYAETENNIAKRTYAFAELRKMRNYENRMWPEFDLCLVCSEEDKKIIQSRISKQSVEVVPNGVDIEYFKPLELIRDAERGMRNEDGSPHPAPRKPHNENNSLVYTGEIGWHPNKDAIIYFAREIWPLIKKEVKDVLFYVVGNNPPDEIKKLSEKDTSIIVTGFVEDIREYIGKASVFVTPLRIGSGTRLKILEAMAMGKPVVSTSIGCEGIEVTNGENIIVADKPAEFKDKVIELFNNQQLKTSLSISARKLIEERYSWGKITQKLNNIISGLKII